MDGSAGIVFDAAALDTPDFVFSILFMVLIAAPCALPFLIAHFEKEIRLFAIGLGVYLCMLCGGIALGCFLAIPHSYAVTPDAIVINRYWRDISIPFSDIDEIREIGNFKWERGLAWNPGVFGYIGRFRADNIGAFTAYVTNWKYSVVITRKSDRPVVISPDRPASFVFSVKQMQ